MMQSLTATTAQLVERRIETVVEKGDFGKWEASYLKNATHLLIVRAMLVRQRPLQIKEGLERKIHKVGEERGLTPSVVWQVGRRWMD